jgi:hypothetical protein
MLLTEAVEGGLVLAGHANTSAELIKTARTKICRAPACKEFGRVRRRRPVNRKRNGTATNTEHPSHPIATRLTEWNVQRLRAVAH